jgi:hypothetical protein
MTIGEKFQPTDAQALYDKIDKTKPGQESVFFPDVRKSVSTALIQL